MKTLAHRLFSKMITKFICFLAIYLVLTIPSYAAGFVDVEAISVSELPVTVGQNFKINFWLKEYRHDAKNFEYIEVWIQDKNKKDLFKVNQWKNISFSSDQIKDFSTTTYLDPTKGRNPGDYFAVVRGKLFGNKEKPFNFGTAPKSNASHPYKFAAISPVQDSEVFSNYGSGNSVCNTCNFYNTGKHPIEQPYHRGMPFTVPSNSSYKLKSISITAFNEFYTSTPPTYIVSVRDDLGGLPGEVLEQFTFTNFNGSDFNHPVLLTGISSSNPTLYGGNQYWITTDVSQPNSMVVGWPMNSKGFTSLIAWYAGSQPWSLIGPETLGAFRVMGTPTLNSVLKLYSFYDENKTHPLLISVTNPSSKSSSIKTNIKIENNTETWFEVDVNFNAPSNRARWPINLADGKPIPFAFLIGPSGKKTFENIEFTGDQYLQLNVTRTSSAAFSALAMDTISRAFFGAPLPTNIFDGTNVLIENLFKTIRSHCSGELGAFGFAVANKNIFGAVENLGQFVLCTKTVKEQMLALVRYVFGQGNSVKLTEILGKESKSILSLLFSAPTLTELIYSTFKAEVDGFVRLEARFK